MKKRTTPFGPGGRLIVGGLGGLVVLFLLWQFVIPFFFGSSTASNNNTSANGSNAAPRAELEGTILDAATGRPLSSASVRQADGTEVAKVDGNGQFSIAKLPADKDKLTISAPGFQTTALPLSKEAAHAIQLKPFVLTGTLIDSDTQQPIANRLLRGGNQATTTDEAGKFTFSGLPDGSKITVDLIGYETVEKTVDSKTSDLQVAIRSTAFDGTLTDSKSGKPVANALLKTDTASATTGQDGKFHFNDLKHDDSTVLKVRAPGYKIQSFKATELAKGAKLEPFTVRAVYVPGVFAIRANYDDLFTPYLQMADKGEINTIVLGMKNDDDGMLWYDSQTPTAKQFNLVKRTNDGKFNADLLMDIPKLLADAKKHNLYVVARYVVMRDPALAKAKPEWALRNNRTGGAWQDDNKLSWPNAFIPEVGDYNAGLAKELAGLGFDEVQYDYIRFPTDGKLKEIQYKPDLNWTQLSDNEDLRTSTIEGIVKKAYDALRSTDTFLSLDVFGMSLWREDDNNIGQQYNNLVMLSDYICPMIYPTHFETGTLDQKQYPGQTGNYPGVIIQKSGVIANKLEAKLKPIAKYRPWLEDFSLFGVKDTPEHLRLQLQAADDTGATGWTLWNSEGKYTHSVLLAWSQSHKL